jgi:dipeptidyl-peptidase-3
MDPKIKQHYLADSPPTVVRLEIKPHFEALKDEKLKRYAHYMSRFGSLLVCFLLL